MGLTEAVEPRFKPEERDRNVNAALALLKQRRAIATKAHRKFYCPNLLMAKRRLWAGYGLDPKTLQKLETRWTNLQKAIEDVKVVERALRRLLWAEHRLAEAEEKEWERTRTKKLAEIDFDPNWPVHGPNEVLEARKWWR